MLSNYHVPTGVSSKSLGGVTDFQVIRLIAITYSVDYVFSTRLFEKPISEFAIVEITDSVFLSLDILFPA